MLCFGKSGQKSLFQIKGSKNHITWENAEREMAQNQCFCVFFHRLWGNENRPTPILGGVVIFCSFFCPQPSCPFQTLVWGACNILVWVCCTFLSNLFFVGVGSSVVAIPFLGEVERKVVTTYMKPSGVIVTVHHVSSKAYCKAITRSDKNIFHKFAQDAMTKLPDYRFPC